MHDLQNDFPALRHFVTGHLPTHLQGPGDAFREMAEALAMTALNLPADHPGRDDARALIRDLLRTKDGAVRLAVDVHQHQSR